MTSTLVLLEDRAEITTARGVVYVIDLEDVPSVRGRSWSTNHKGYAVSNRKPRPSGMDLLHRILLDAPKDLQVDHIDGDPKNNRRSNLRLCSCADNQKNQRRHSNNTSGFKGVHWNKQRKRWRAEIMINRRTVHLGYFDTPEQASAAYQDAAVHLFGEFKRATEHE